MHKPRRMDKENPLVDIERLHFILGVKPRFQDPLCGLGEQLVRLADLNVIEEIMLEPCVHADAPRIMSAVGGWMLYSPMNFPYSAGF